MQDHAARPRLVVDNSRRIAGLRSQETLGKSDVFLSRHFSYRAAKFPCNAVRFPLVYGLTIDSFARPLSYPSGNDRPVSQPFNKARVILHGRSIVREFFGFVNLDISDDPESRRIDTERMANSDDKSPEAVEAGQRLSLLRGALGYPMRRRYAEFLSTRTNEDWDVWEKRLEKYESGNTMLPVYLARLIRHLHKVPYECLYDGEWDALPHHLYDALKNYQKDAS